MIVQKVMKFSVLLIGSLEPTHTLWNICVEIKFSYSKLFLFIEAVEGLSTLMAMNTDAKE